MAYIAMAYIIVSACPHCARERVRVGVVVPVGFAPTHAPAHSLNARTRATPRSAVAVAAERDGAVAAMAPVSDALRQEADIDTAHVCHN